MTREVPDWAKKIAPFVDRHLSESDKEELKNRYDGVAWERLIAQAKSLLGTDPASPAALALASRWKDLTASVTGDNRSVKKKTQRYTAGCLGRSPNSANITGHP
jgi:MerR family transcriptional regulator, thiopeptide resistance regulator